MNEEKNLKQETLNSKVENVSENKETKKQEKKTIADEKPLIRKKSQEKSNFQEWVNEDEENAKVSIKKANNDEIAPKTKIMMFDNTPADGEDAEAQDVEKSLIPHIEYIEEQGEEKTEQKFKIPKRFKYLNIGLSISFLIACVCAFVFLIWGVALCVYFSLGLFAAAFACSCGYDYFLLASIKTITFEEWKKAEEETASLLSDEAQQKAYTKRMNWLKFSTIARVVAYGLLSMFSVIVMLLY